MTCVGNSTTVCRSPSPWPQALPGIALCASVAALAHGLEWLEVRLAGRAWLEPLVLAILVGALIRTVWAPGAGWRMGVEFSAKTLLEIAVALLGASVSLDALGGVGWPLLAGIAATVMAVIALSFAMGRLLGLGPRLALLVACGNSICGNSAIAAVAPVIGAEGEEVAASIAFTAVLGVIVVLAMPFLQALLGYSATQIGIFAGLTVYAVPQVLAATASAGTIAIQIGTLVKLVRVLMLGPVVMMLSACVGPARSTIARPRASFVPWFVAAFLALAGAHSLHLLPNAVIRASAPIAASLTVLSMAALGLCTDVRTLARAGGRVTATVVGSLLLLGLISYGLIRGLGIV